MKLIAASLILICLSVTAQNPRCGCGSVPIDANPSMGNKLIVESGKNLRKIQGRIVFPNYITNVEEPGREIIVQVYRYTEADKNIEIYNVPNGRDSVASCLTGDDGRFCFDHLSSGKYVLRVGTLRSEGWNGRYILVNLETRWWWGW